MNSCHFIGRLTRDPEVRTFSNGGKVTRFGIAVNNRKKNPQTGEWEDDPAFLDMEAWAKTAEFVEEHFKKGDPIVICQSTVKQENWEKDGQKRSKLVFTAERVEFVPKTRDNAEGVGVPRKTKAASTRGKAAASTSADYDEGVYPINDDDQIPF